MTELIEIDLCLKGHVYFNKVAEGVYFQGQSGGFVLKGENIYPLVAKIVSLIDNGYSLDAINTKLPVKMQAFFSSLVKRLYESEMLIERCMGKGIPPEWIKNKNFDSFLTFLKENSDNFENKIAAWQKQDIMVFGDGLVLKAAVSALAAAGLKKLSVVMVETDDAQVSESEIKDLLNESAEKFIGFEYFFDKKNKLDEIPFDQYDQVIQCSTNLDIVPLLSMETTNIVAGVIGGHAIVSPITSISNSGFRDLIDQLTPQNVSLNVSFPALGLSILGNLAALNLIKSFFGIQTRGISDYVYSVSALLEISRHPLIPASRRQDFPELEDYSSSSYAFQKEYETPEDREMDLYERVNLSLAPLFDRLFGCFDESSGDTIKQVPLFHSKISTRFPASWELDDANVICCGADASISGLRAISESISFRSSAQLGVPHHLIATAFDYDEWCQQALARAFAYSEEFKTNSSSILLNLNVLGDEETQIAVHYLLAAGYLDGSLELHWNENKLSFVARLSKPDGSASSACIASTAARAIRECLCAAYVRVQFPEVDLLVTQGANLNLVSPTIIDKGETVFDELRVTQTHNAPSNVDYVRDLPFFGANEIYSGYAVI
ncbi:MAG: hypothetical protein ACI9SP_000836 [Arenicella sp.]|jgi:hypothetical protein